MKPKRMTWLSTLMALFVASTPAWSATVCGIARDAQGQPVAGVQVLIKDSNGQVLGQATTDQSGKYIVNGVDGGTVDLFLEPGATGYKGGTGVLTLTEANGMVNWQVSNAADAAAEQLGTCDPAGWTAGEIAVPVVIGLAALGSGLGLGFGIGSDSPSGSSAPHAASASQ